MALSTEGCDGMSIEPEKSRAACSDEVWRARQPNPRDVKYQRVVDQYNYQDEISNPERGTVRYAWREYKISRAILWRAIKHWVNVLPCRFWFHASEPVPQYGNLRVCRRCGAWREQ